MISVVKIPRTMSVLTADIFYMCIIKIPPSVVTGTNPTTSFIDFDFCL